MFSIKYIAPRSNSGPDTAMIWYSRFCKWHFLLYIHVNIIIIYVQPLRLSNTARTTRGVATSAVLLLHSV